MEPAFNDSPVENTIDILSRFSFDDGRYALVLDDFYFITNEDILKSIIYILKRLPLSVTAIILSRNELPRFFASLKDSDKIAFIDASDAEPYYFIKVFADEGRAILPIVNRLRKKLSIESESTPNYKYLYEIHQATYDQSKRQRGITYNADRPIKLSKQQKFILELLAKVR